MLGSLSWGPHFSSKSFVTAVELAVSANRAALRVVASGTIVERRRQCLAGSQHSKFSGNSNRTSECVLGNGRSYLHSAVGAHIACKRKRNIWHHGHATCVGSISSGLSRSLISSATSPSQAETGILGCNIRTDIFKAMLSIISGGVAKRAPASPVLTHVFMQTFLPSDEEKEGKLLVMATDMALAIHCTVPAEVISAGQTAVPAKTLIQLLKNIKSDKLQVTGGKSQGGIKLRGQGGMYELAGESASGFPPVPTFENATRIVFPASVLREAFKRTRCAAAREDLQFAAVNLCVTGGEARFAATDGRRAATYTAPVEVDPAFEGVFNLSVKLVDEMRSLRSIPQPKDKESRVKKAPKPPPGEAPPPPPAPETVVLELLPNQIAATVDDGLSSCTVTSQLLLGDFPDLTAVISRAPEVELTLQRDALVEAVQQAEVFAKIGTKSVGRVEFLLQEGSLVLNSSSSDVGGAQVTIDVDYVGPPLKVAFNPSLFLDGIDAIHPGKGQEIVLGLSRENGGIALLKDDKGVYVLVGMRDGSS